MPDPSDLNTELLAEYVARGHAWPKHAQGMDPNGGIMNGQNAFRFTDVGPDLRISTPEDLQDYIQRMIRSPDTRGFVDPGRQSVHLYNQADNTMLILTDTDAHDFGTIYRYPDGADTFNSQLRKAKAGAPDPKNFVQFDNAADAGAAQRSVDSFIEMVQGRAASNAAYRSAMFSQNPGVAISTDARFTGTTNLSTTGMSNDYTAFTRRLDMVENARPALTSGRGAILAVNETVAENSKHFGRATHMAFLDEAANTVTEVRDGAIVVHRFDHLPAAEQGRLAEQFFDRLREGATVHEGGLNGLIENVRSGSEVNLPGGRTITAKPPSGITGTDRVFSNIREGATNVRNAVGYTSVDEAARVMLSMDAVQGEFYNRIPDSIPADDLLKVTDPKAVEALRELSDLKSVIDGAETGEEALAFLDEFKTTVNGLDSHTRAAVTQALADIGKAPVDEAADLARATARGADALDALSDLAKLVKSAKISRLALNTSKVGIVTTVVTTGLAVGATSYANATTLSIADQLHASGHLTDEAYTEYKAMMDEVGPMLTGQAADPTPLAIPGMVIVENIAMNRFQSFSDKHQLPQNIHEMLSPAMIPGLSLRASLSSGVSTGLPDDPSAVNPLLHDLVVAHNEVRAAGAEYLRVYDEVAHPAQAAGVPPIIDFALEALTAPDPMAAAESPEMALLQSDQAIRKLGETQAILSNPRVVSAHQAEKDAIAKFATEFDRLLADPRGAEALANELDPQQLLDIVKATAQFQDRSTLDPLVVDYLNAEDAYNNTAFYELIDQWNTSTTMGEAEEALRRNPEVMRDYLSSVFVWEGPANGLGLHDKCFAVADVQQDPNYQILAAAMERLKEGGSLYRTEEAELRRFVNNAAGSDEAIVDALKENYGEEIAPYIDEETSASPAYGPVHPSLGTYAIP